VEESFRELREVAGIPAATLQPASPVERKTSFAGALG